MTRPVISGSYGLHLPLRTVPPKPRGRKRIWYKPNHRSFGAFMRSDQMRDPVADVARDISILAAMRTPRSEGDKDGAPHMADSYEVRDPKKLIKVNTSLRVVVEVINTAGHAPAVEFGKGDNPGKHILRNVATDFGDLKPREGTP